MLAVALIVVVAALAGVIGGAAAMRARRSGSAGNTAESGEAQQPVSVDAGVQSALSGLPAGDHEDGEVLLRAIRSGMETVGERETSPEPGLAGGAAEPPAPAIDPYQPMVALTFDDGPSATLTPQLLDILRDNDVHATFFVVGYNLDGNEDILRRAVAEGHEIGNHTSNHPHLRSLSDAELDSEIAAMRQRIVDVTGQEVVPIRPPYGETNDQVDSHITDPVILWSVDSRDWADRDVGMAVGHIQNDTFDGSIILMHDIHPETVEAAATFIPWLKEQGYQLVTVSELGQYRLGGLTAGTHYFSITPDDIPTPEEPQEETPQA